MLKSAGNSESNEYKEGNNLRLLKEKKCQSMGGERARFAIITGKNKEKQMVHNWTAAMEKNRRRGAKKEGEIKKNYASTKRDKNEM